MSDEAEVVEQVKTEVAPNAEETTTAPDPEPDVRETEDDGSSEAHPLQPGGDRFKQVWARAKTAEAERDQFREQIQREREERIRMEERLKAVEEAKAAKAEPEYTWAQLESAIAEGKIDRAWASEYKERQLVKKAEELATKKVEERLRSTSHESTVLSEIDQYKQMVPEITQAGSQERQKVEAKFAYLVQTLGYAPTHATELVATQMALGDLDTVKRQVAAKRSTVKEPFMETHSSTQKPQQSKNDPIAKLSDAQKKHYERMIERGMYKDWNEVKEELNFTPKYVRA